MLMFSSPFFTDIETRKNELPEEADAGDKNEMPNIIKISNRHKHLFILDTPFSIIIQIITQVHIRFQRYVFTNML